MRATKSRWAPPAAFAVAFLLTLAPGPAGAASFSEQSSHYNFEYPDGWAQEARAGIDGLLSGPVDGSTRPTIVAQHEAEPTARNASEWLLQYVKNSLNALKQSLNITEVQAPRTFTTAGGRLAGDYVFERSDNGVLLRQRQVYFVSEYYHFAYYLTFTDKSPSYGNHTDAWDRAVDSFAVTGEPAASLFSGPLPLILIIAVVAAVLALVIMRASKKRAASAAPPPLTPAAPPAPPARPPPR